MWIRIIMDKLYLYNMVNMLNKISGVKRRKVIAIRNFDEELYRVVKAYASLEGRTIASILEEALSRWIESRGDYDEVRIWVELEKAYESNIKALEKNMPHTARDVEGYIVVCDGRVVGIYSDYREAAEKSHSTCRVHGLIVKLPWRRKKEIVELGLPW